MVQIPTRTRTRTLSFSVREAGCPPRTRPLDPHARGEEPDAKRARQSYAPVRVPRSATPLAPKSVNLTVTAVPFPTDDSCSDDAQWGTSALPAASTSTSTPTSPAPRPKRLVARTVSAPSASKPKPKPTPAPAPCTTTLLQAVRARRPSPLAPYWKPSEFPMTRPRRGRLPPEPLARKALKAHFAQTPHGAAVVKLGARRAIAQAECVEALERVRRLSGEKSVGSGIAANRRGAVGSVGCPGGVSRAQLLPPVVMVERSGPIPGSGFVRFPTSPTRLDTLTDDGWVPLSVQPAPMEVEVEECDIVEMETDGWSRL